MKQPQELSIANRSIIALRVFLYMLAAIIVLPCVLAFIVGTTDLLNDVKNPAGVVVIGGMILLINVFSHTLGSLSVIVSFWRGQFDPATTITRNRIRSIVLAMLLTGLFLFEYCIASLLKGKLFYFGYEHTLWLTTVASLWIAAILASLMDVLFFDSPTRSTFHRALRACLPNNFFD